MAGLQIAPLGLLAHTAPFVKAAEPVDTAAQRAVSIYDPPPIPQRPVELDYPSGAPADAEGNLTRDIEGRPLRARWVVGRKVVGGDDQPLPGEEYDSLTEAGTGKRPQTITPGQIQGAAGAVALNRFGEPTDLYLSSALTSADAPKVHAHELSHVVDALAGNISNKGLMRELRDVYNTLNNPTRTADGTDADPAAKPVTPPRLSKIIQFNSLAAASAGDDPDDYDNNE